MPGPHARVGRRSRCSRPIAGIGASVRVPKPKFASTQLDAVRTRSSPRREPTATPPADALERPAPERRKATWPRPQAAGGRRESAASGPAPSGAAPPHDVARPRRRPCPPPSRRRARRPNRAPSPPVQPARSMQPPEQAGPRQATARAPQAQRPEAPVPVRAPTCSATTWCPREQERCRTASVAQVPAPGRQGRVACPPAAAVEAAERRAGRDSRRDRRSYVHPGGRTDLHARACPRGRPRRPPLPRRHARRASPPPIRGGRA
jgi:hypothetical protein